jgi:hypothetical protein
MNRFLFLCAQRSVQVMIGLVALLFPCTSSGAKPEFPEASLVRGKTVTGYSYVNGGLGADEQRAMAGVSDQYNVKLIFARVTGSPIIRAALLLATNNGGRIDNIPITGPLFYIKLPLGVYTLVARFSNRVVMIRDFRISDGLRRTLVLRGD